jgi:hypothetical protein
MQHNVVQSSTRCILDTENAVTLEVSVVHSVFAAEPSSFVIR